MHCSTWALTAASFATGATALGTIALAVATNNWLITIESFKPIFDENNTYGDDDYSYDYYGNDTIVLPFMSLTGQFRIGLWRICIAVLTVPDTENCKSLPYTDSLDSKEKIDQQETSTAIAEAQRGATPVFVVSLLLMMIAAVLNVVGNLRQDIKTLIAAIFYINAGLCIAVGIVLYITFINDEAHSAKPTTEDYMFSYSYGWSAYLLGISFLASESAAVLCVTLFLKRYPKVENMLKIIPGLEGKCDLTDKTEKGTLIL